MKRTLIAALYRIKKKWLVHFLMYLVSLVLTAIPMVLFYQTLKKQAGNSLSISELVEKFSFMLFGDFMHASGKAFSPFLWYSLGIGFLGSLVYTFFTGGVIDELAQPKRDFSLGRFFKKSAQYFWKYFILLILLGLLLFSLFLVSGIIYFVFVLLAEGSSERGYFFWLLLPTIILFIFFSFGLVVSFYAKVFMNKEQRLKPVASFWKAFYFVFKHKKTLLFFWTTLIIAGLLVLVYLLLDKYIGASSGLSIALMFVFQQGLILSKFVMKHWNYAIALDYLEQNPIELYTPKAEPVLDETFVSEEETSSDKPDSNDARVNFNHSDSKLSEPEKGL